MPVSRSFPRVAVLLGLGVLLASCERNPLVVRRSVCPAVAVPTYAGDMTLFRGASADANAIDVVASITNVRETCGETEGSLTTAVTYDVVARRTDPAGARSVAVPVFATMVQGGNLIVSKQVGSVTIAFADGQARAAASGSARGQVLRSATALPPDIQKTLTRKRKAGDLDAATDPMSDPQVRAALRATSFELLIGFQLSEAGLAYNVSK